MTCQCAELCQSYGNCTLEHVAGLENVRRVAGYLPPDVSERYRCPECGQVWELRNVLTDGELLPWIVKQGVVPDPDAAE